MGSGWICLHRKLIEHPSYKDSDFVHVWIHLLLNASHSKIKMWFNGDLIEVQPGQLITGRKSIALATGVQESKVNRIIKRLQAEQQIEQLAGSRSSLFTITNWATYQISEQPIEQQVNSKRTANEQQMNTNNNENNVTSTKDKGANRVQFQKPTIEEVKAFFAEQGLTENDAAAFFDGKEGNGWRNGSTKIRDWKATVRSWKAAGYHPSQKAIKTNGVNRNIGTCNKPERYAGL